MLKEGVAVGVVIVDVVCSSFAFKKYAESNFHINYSCKQFQQSVLNKPILYHLVASVHDGGISGIDTGGGGISKQKFPPL